MSGIVDGLLEQLGSSGTAQLASAVGADESQMGSLIRATLPALIGGMSNNARTPGGATSLSGALDQHDAGIFGDLGALLGGGSSDGDAILGHVLGQKRPSVEQNLAGRTGVDMSLITKLLPLLAPLVLSYLSKQKQDRGLDDRGVGAMVNEERAAIESREPGLGGLASILDADGDGSVLDEVIDLASGAAGGQSAGSKSGGLGGLLGKILGGRR